MKKTKQKNTFFEVSGLISLVSGVVFGLLSLIGFMGLVILYLANSKMELGTFEIGFSVVISLISFFCAYAGYKGFTKNKGFKFYNAIFLFALGIVNLISTILTDLELSMGMTEVIFSAVFGVFYSVSFIINGIYLLKK